MPFLGFVIKPLAMALVLAGIFSLVWMRTRVMEVKYHIAEVERSRDALLAEQKKLIALKTRFASPGRIASQARTLGLHVPDRADVYLVRYDSRVVRARSQGRTLSSSPRL